MRKGQIIEFSIDDLASEGDGVGRWQGMAVFVPGTLPGERVKVRLNKIKKSFAGGEIEEIISPSEARIDPECRDYSACGGCNLQHVDYGAQLDNKWKIVSDSLTRIGKITGVKVNPVLGMDYPWHYRNKVHLHAGGEKANVKLGFFASESHRLASKTGNCLLANNELNKIAVILQELLNKYQVEPYFRKKRKGLLHSVMLRIGESTGEIMAVLVTAPGKWEEGEELARELMAKHSGIVSVIRNINSGLGKMVMGNKNQVLAGNGTIRDKLCGLVFHISANSFYQVNPFQTERLYKKALEFADLTGKEKVVDAYCGIGTIALYLAGYASTVLGLESVPQAVEDAKNNARLNNMTNTEFKTGEVEKLLPSLAREGLNPDVVVLDPSRKGCEKEVLQAISEIGVPRVIYVSCDPGTLARDLGRMRELGYKTEEVQPVDMFPWTTHVECVVLIEQV